MQHNILIAGGTGLIGTALTNAFEKSGHQVFILTRNQARCKDSKYRWWNPDMNEISENALESIDIIINLCGSGIADKPWTNKRKQELHDSRVKPALVLFEAAKKNKQIKHYISASGINCYPLNTAHPVQEEDAYGNDYLSRLVQEWEHAALKFEALCPVTLLRISAVLSENGGALDKLKPLFKWGLGSPLGTGKQPFTWIHEQDLVRAIVHLTENQLAGAYNICGNTVSNKDFSKALAQSVNRWMLPVGVPALIMRLMLGEMSEMLLNGVNANAEKLKTTGFVFENEEIEQALG
jgi:uncharacterized protein (TIGR01777 family)